MPEVLVHSCCAPCSIMPLRHLEALGYTPLIWYGNPNIEPEVEYRLRRSAMRDYASQLGYTLIEGCYDPATFHDTLAPYQGIYPLIEGDREYDSVRQKKQDRCCACYRLRFERLAAVARERGIAAIATSLSVSPWQFVDSVAEELERAATECGLHSLFVDHRGDYPEATRLSRQLGMYRQNYCGCAASRKEAELEREARRALRRKMRTQKRPESDYDADC